MALPGALTAVVDVAERFPRRTLRVIAARAGDADPEALTRLSGVVNSSPALADALTEADEAPAEPSPRSSTSPTGCSRSPRRRATAAAGRPAVEDQGPQGRTDRGRGLTPTIETRLVWGDDEEAQHWATAWTTTPTNDSTPRTSSECSTVLRGARPVPRPDGLLRLGHHRGRRTEARGLGRHRQGTRSWELMRILGRFGPRAADRVAGLAKGRNPLGNVLMPIQNLAAARIAADWLSRSKSMRPLATQLVRPHAAAAAHLLIPDALGGDRPLRRAANTALRHLITFHGTETVSAAAQGVRRGRRRGDRRVHRHRPTRPARREGPQAALLGGADHAAPSTPEGTESRHCRRHRWGTSHRARPRRP